MHERCKLVTSVCNERATKTETKTKKTRWRVVRQQEERRRDGWKNGQIHVERATQPGGDKTDETVRMAVQLCPTERLAPSTYLRKGTPVRQHRGHCPQLDSRYYVVSC